VFLIIIHTEWFYPALNSFCHITRL